jgi:hypothetical protein
MLRFQFRIDERLGRRARAEARRRGISMSELCRLAVVAALPQQRRAVAKPWMRYSGVISGNRGGESDSGHIDRVVYGSGRRR